MQKIPLARTFFSVSEGEKYQASGSMGAAGSFSLLGFYADGFLIPDVESGICPGLNLLPFCVLHCNPVRVTFSLGKLHPANIFLSSCWFLLYLTSCSWSILTRADFPHNNQTIHVGFVIAWLTAFKITPQLLCLRWRKSDFVCDSWFWKERPRGIHRAGGSPLDLSAQENDTPAFLNFWYWDFHWDFDIAPLWAAREFGCICTQEQQRLLRRALTRHLPWQV